MTIAATAPLNGASAKDCDAACLRGHMDRYLTALVERDPKRLQLSADVRFTENGTPGKLGDGLWRSAVRLGDFRHVFADTASQQALFLGKLEEGSAPAAASPTPSAATRASSALVALRLGVRGGVLAEIEHVVARPGSHPLFAPQTFVAHPTLTQAIPAERRLAREQLIAIADSYFTGIERHSSRDVLASQTCQRIENGVQTTGRPGRGSQHCAASADLLTYIKGVNDRRFPIVDIEHGIVVATVLFDIPGEISNGNDPAIAADPQVAARLREPRTLLLTEWFRIDAGKIQHIEAVMHNLPPGTGSGWEAAAR